MSPSGMALLILHLLFSKDARKQACNFLNAYHALLLLIMLPSLLIITHTLSCFAVTPQPSLQHSSEVNRLVLEEFYGLWV